MNEEKSAMFDYELSETDVSERNPGEFLEASVGNGNAVTSLKNPVTLGDIWHNLETAGGIPSFGRKVGARETLQLIVLLTRANPWTPAKTE